MRSASKDPDAHARGHALPNQYQGAIAVDSRVWCDETRTATYYSAEENMSKEVNLQTLSKFAEAVNTGKFELFKDAVSSENIDHDPASGQEPGPEGYRTFFGGLRKGFPDLNVALETLVADDESIAIAYTLSGTQNGAFMGHAPTGRKMKIRGVQIAKFKDGKMIERWGSSDELGLLQQLGIAAVS
jgi:steroid delta-isomerase-like uncharacterized protein